jgi:hypothetical protein
VLVFVNNHNDGYAPGDNPAAAAAAGMRMSCGPGTGKITSTAVSGTLYSLQRFAPGGNVS